MNYGKNNLSKRKSSISSKKKMKKKRVGVRFFKAVITCMLLLVVIGLVGGIIFAKKIIDNTPDVSAEDIQPKGFTTTIVDQNGTVIDTLKDSDSNRVYRTYDEITAKTDFLPHAFVAIEDERFYEHNGIDIQGILRAGVVGVMNGFDFTEGASTLTQQLIKNNVFDFVNEKTFFDRVERKLQEQYLALAFEKEMNKNEILEAYLNTINLGQGCLGVQTASTRYFNKDVADLTLSECAVIAAITQNPTEYDPVTNPESNAKRREKVLGNMLEQKYIDQAQYDEALADPVYDRILQTAAITEDTTPYSYFTDALIEDVIQDLMDEKGYSETQAYNLLYSEGLTIKSTQDLAIQQICDEEASNDAYYPIVEYGITDYALTIHRADGSAENYSKENLKQYLISVRGSAAPFVFSSEDEAKASIEQYKGTLGINTDAGDIVDERLNITLQPQVSVVLMDQYTGHVKAIVGGRGAKTTSLSLNRATASPKQPGSCFKVLSTYAPGLNECGMTLATTIKDEPYRYASGQPVNNRDNKYIGSARVRYAIEHSMNVCAVRTLTETVGLEKGYKYLENFGFTTLVNNDPNYPGMSDIAQATALGGITRGVYNIEMTAAYAAIANSGIYTEPLLYTEILDHDGNVLIDNSKPITRRVLKESTAFLLTSAMQDVINRGTGTPARLNNMPAAGKTGTTENSTDLWLSAYTPYYTCSVWTGYDEDKTLEQFWNQSWHEVIWKHIMDRTHAELEYKNITPPASVLQRTICTQTGKLAVNGCPSITEYFDKDTLTKETCPGHGKTDDESKDDENNEDNSTNNNSGSSENLGNTNGDDGDDVDPIPPTPDPEPNPEPEGPEVIPQSRN